MQVMATIIQSGLCLHEPLPVTAIMIIDILHDYIPLSD